MRKELREMAGRISAAVLFAVILPILWPMIGGPSSSVKVSPQVAVQVASQQAAEYSGALVTFGLTTVTLIAMVVFKTNFGRKFAVQDAKIDVLSSELGKLRSGVSSLGQTTEYMAEKLTRLDERFVAFPADVGLKISSAIEKRRLESEAEFVPVGICKVMHADLNRRVDRIEDLAEKRALP
jgi:hypothetical protein